MNLHRATGVGEFCCENGVAIQMELKCDGYIDCADRSDEHNCSLIEGEQGTKALTAPLTDIYISHISAQGRGPAKPRRKTKVLTIVTGLMTSIILFTPRWSLLFKSLF